jgi:hypothetical protein
MPFPPTPSQTPSNTPTPSITPSNTPSYTPTGTVCPGLTPTATSTIAVTPTTTPTPTQTQTGTGGLLISPTPTNTSTSTPTQTPTPTELSCQCYRIDNNTEGGLDVTYTPCGSIETTVTVPGNNAINICVEPLTIIYRDPGLEFPIFCNIDCINDSQCTVC